MILPAADIGNLKGLLIFSLNQQPHCLLAQKHWQTGGTAGTQPTVSTLVKLTPVGIGLLNHG